MKKEMSSFDIMAAVAEMQPLVGGRIDQVYQVGRDELIIRIRTPEKVKREVYVRAGKWVCPRDGVEKPLSPPPFGMSLRKHIANAIVEAIEQRGFERVVVLRLQKRESYELVLELFGKGNVVLVKDGVIVQPMFHQSWRSREVRGGETYAFPPERADPLSMSPEEFKSALTDSDLDLVRTLALDVNLGGTYAEELCARTGVEKSTMASDVEERQALQLYEALQSLAESVAQGGQGSLVMEDGELVDATPVPLAIHSHLEAKSVESFAQALAAFLDAQVAIQPPEPREEERRGRPQRRLENLQAAREALLTREGEFRVAAEFVYANFQIVEEALTAVRDGSRTNLVREVNFERHWVEIDIAGRQVRLDTRLGVNQNADALYEKAKDARRKAGALVADIEEARERLAVAEAKPEEPAPTTTGKVFWFERFRWFLSSEGNLVLGGRDAKSNESLVKKHLKPGDRYIHADIHGAPSVVVKDGASAGEATLEEASQLAVAYSKLWRVEAGSGAAYCVNPEQVSKTPQSGEFLAKGAFVIRGKRNYRRNLALQAGVGLTSYEGERKVMGGPPIAVSSHCSAYVIVAPGGGSREDLAAALAEKWDVSMEEVVRALPSGGIRILETVPGGLVAL